MVTTPVVFLYAVGLIAFILGLEEDETPIDFIYLGLAFFVNMMAYYMSYSDVAYTQSAYLPLILMVVSVLFLIYKVYLTLSGMFVDKYETGEEE